MDTWSKVQAIKKINNESPISQSNFKGEFILSGLLRCPVCGAGTVMSKRPKRDGSGHHLYYMCQSFHTKGKTVCSSNLINKKLIEGQLLQFIRTILADDQTYYIMKRLKSEESRGSELEKDLEIQKTCLKKLIEKQKKQDADYYEEKIKAELYNRLSEALELELNECKRVITHLEREIEKLQSAVIINKEIILEALMNFDSLFEDATNEEKRTLLRALIKEIHVEADRKSIKNIVFWFTEDDGNSMYNALPMSEERRALS